MVSGEAEVFVTCFRAWTFGLSESPNPRTKVNFRCPLSRFLYEMTLDDESDQFRGEVSLLRNYRDETLFFTIHAFLMIFQSKTFLPF